MVSVHLVGMGLLGSFLAWTLFQHEYSFTWEDNDSAYCAWKATTGTIYPSGEEEDMQAYRVWQQWEKGDAPWCTKIPSFMEKGAYWFASKHPPHGGNYPILKDVGPLRLGALPTFHLNGQQFVAHTRRFFEKSRRKSPPTGSKIIHAHGFTHRLHHYVWGWTVKVRLEIDPTLLHCSQERPMLYLRKGRFQLGYAYPVPGEPWHYAGTSLIVQRVPKSLAIPPKFAYWQQHVATMTDSLVKVVQKGEVVEGWRPVADSQDRAWVTQKDGALWIRPLWSSGIRHAPLMCQAVLQMLQ